MKMNKTKKEPIKNGKLWIIFGVIFLLSVPWYLPAGSYQPLVLGMPYWALIVIIMSVVLSSFLTYVIKHHWQLDEEDEHTKEEE
jgi:uncharacterized membrane protein